MVQLVAVDDQGEERWYIPPQRFVNEALDYVALQNLWNDLVPRKVKNNGGRSVRWRTNAL